MNPYYPVNPITGISTHWGANAAGNKAAGDVAQTVYQQPAQFAGIRGGLFDSMSKGFGAYGNALANLANTQANENANRYAAYGTAESARQAALGGMGTAAIAGYGNAANAANQAWAANQTAMMKAMADMANANQFATSQYGAGREAALGTLGNSYAQAGMGFGNNRAQLGQAYGTLGAAGANAYGTLGGTLGAAGSQLGGSAMQSLGSMRGQAANALGNVGSSANAAIGNIGSAASSALGNVGSAFSNSIGQLGSSGAMASGNLGGAATNALANLGGSANRAYSDLGGQIGNAMGMMNAAGSGAMGNIGAAGQNAYGTLGSAGSGLGVGLGNAASQVAGGSMNYTRDMAKLGLARLLGLGQLNVASQGVSAMPLIAGGAGGGGVTISGPGGDIAGGSFGAGGGAGSGVGGGGGGVGGAVGGIPPIYMDPTKFPAWYDSQQMYDGGGMAALSGLAGQGFGQLGALQNSVGDAMRFGMDNIRRGVDAGVGELQGLNARNTSAIGDTTMRGQAGIIGSARDGYGAISDNVRSGIGGALSGLGASNSAIGSNARGMAGSVRSQASDAGRMIGRQADRGAADIDRQLASGLGYLGAVGNQGFAGIGSAVGGGLRGLRDESDALAATERNTFGGIGSLRDSIVNSPVLGLMNQNYNTGLSSLRGVYDQSASAPFQMLDQAQRGLADLSGINIAASNRGMDQFYDSQRALNDSFGSRYGDYLSSLNAGYGGLRNDYSAADRGVQDLFTNTLGKNQLFQTPAQRAQAEREADLYQRGATARDNLATAQRYLATIPNSEQLKLRERNAANALRYIPRY